MTNASTNNTPDYLTTTRCDSCGLHGPAVILCDNNANGQRVTAECARCNASAFEDQARFDIDAWLAGEQIYLGVPSLT